MSSLLLKCAGIWVIFIPVAILNGLVCEKCLGPLLGQRLALPFSAISYAALSFFLPGCRFPGSAPWNHPGTG